MNYSYAETKVITKPKTPTALVMVTNQRHKQSWFKQGDCHLLYKLENFYSTVPNVDACKLGAARIIMADQVTEL